MGLLLGSLPEVKVRAFKEIRKRESKRENYHVKWG